MSFTPDSYDPTEVEERPRTSYLSKKDARNLLIAVAGVLLLMTPVYIMMRAQGQKVQCAQNFMAIKDALLLYKEQYDDHLPPICMQGDRREPFLLRGKPFSWASAISQGMNKRASFRCPSAHDDEVVWTYNPVDDKAGLPLTYGMYSAWSAAFVSTVSDPGRAIVIAETSNHGANDTYDPYLFRDSAGRTVPQDGFFIGWDKGNYLDEWSKSDMLPIDQATTVTRLAFPETKNGKFVSDGPSRHNAGIHVLFIDGHTEMLRPTGAYVRSIDVGELSGYWRTR